MSKPRVIFVGAFAESADRAVGGQLFACRALVASPLTEYVEWRLIDTARKSASPPAMPLRVCNALGRVLRLSWLLFTRRIDALLVFSSFGAPSLAEKGLMCFLGRLRRTRVVLSLRSEIRPPRRCRWFARWFLRRVVAATDAVICQSEAAAENLRTIYGCDASRLVVIPNWIDAHQYAAAAVDRTARPADQPPVVLFLNRLERYKGVYELIAAAESLAKEGPPFRLVVCGDGSERAALEKECRRRKLDSFVEFRGFTEGERKLTALREADLFVMPTYSEGLPNALLEAMAAGLPIVTCPVGGIPSLIDAEANGLLVPPRDVQLLAAALRRLLMDKALRQRMGQANLEKLHQRHDIARIWRNVAETLQVSTGYP